MQHGRLKVGIAAAGTLAVAFTLAAQPAFADYAPAAKDVVGVGSDTVQYASDFIADGDYTGDGGYNTLGNKFKVVNFDATPDANARLAYGPGGDSAVRADLGTGGTEGTGNQPGTHTETGVCTLNPTIVLRGGQFPIQRPNGSTAGANAILADSSINYTRASAAKGSTLDPGSNGAFDSITIGTDDLEMLAATNTNAVALSENQLNAIYSCSALTWNQVVSGGSPDRIIPLIPQVGSGTRSTFLADINLSSPGGCVETVEENDPTAIAAATHQTTAGFVNNDTDAASLNAIEPMSKLVA